MVWQRLTTNHMYTNSVAAHFINKYNILEKKWLFELILINIKYCLHGHRLDIQPHKHKDW